MDDDWEARGAYEPLPEIRTPEDDLRARKLLARVAGIPLDEVPSLID